MNKYVIFRAEKDQPGWKGRKFAHTGIGTYILAEHFYSNQTPKVGDRITEFVKLEEHIDPEYPGASTHCKTGDWEVARIEEYTPEIPLSDFDSIFICYCHYIPINASLRPLPPRIISLDSFGGDEKAYQEYMESKTAGVAK